MAEIYTQEFAEAAEEFAEAARKFLTFLGKSSNYTVSFAPGGFSDGRVRLTHSTSDTQVISVEVSRRGVSETKRPARVSV